MSQPIVNNLTDDAAAAIARVGQTQGEEAAASLKKDLARMIAKRAEYLADEERLAKTDPRVRVRYERRKVCHCAGCSTGSKECDREGLPPLAKDDPAGRYPIGPDRDRERFCDPLPRPSRQLQEAGAPAEPKPAEDGFRMSPAGLREYQENIQKLQNGFKTMEIMNDMFSLLQGAKTKEVVAVRRADEAKGLPPQESADASKALVPRAECFCDSCQGGAMWCDFEDEAPVAKGTLELRIAQREEEIRQNKKREQDEEDRLWQEKQARRRALEASLQAQGIDTRTKLSAPSGPRFLQVGHLRMPVKPVQEVAIPRDQRIEPSKGFTNKLFETYGLSNATPQQVAAKSVQMARDTAMKNHMNDIRQLAPEASDYLQTLQLAFGGPVDPKEVYKRMPPVPVPEGFTLERLECAVSFRCRDAPLSNAFLRTKKTLSKEQRAALYDTRRLKFLHHIPVRVKDRPFHYRDVWDFELRVVLDNDAAVTTEVMQPFGEFTAGVRGDVPDRRTFSLDEQFKEEVSLVLARSCLPSPARTDRLVLARFDVSMRNHA